MTYTPVDKLPQIHAELRDTFSSGLTLPIEWRQTQLRKLARMLKDNHQAFADAVHKDLGRPYMETYTVEITGTINRVNGAADLLPAWASTNDLTGAVTEMYKSWSPNTVKRPKGVALVIAPWNHPIFISLVPLLGAIAAGCCCVLKVSEISPHFSATTAELLPKYLDPRAFRVILGAVPETTVLLKLKWDHIFYTGNASVGRIIAHAAAEHLTPITLELGSKCPAIIDPSYDLDVAARRILMGKISNAGQICVAPDYVLVPRGNRDALIDAFRRAITQFFPSGALKSDSYSHIVSLAHFRRLQNLLRNTKGTVLLGFGGKIDESTLGMEPILLVDVDADDQEEIFGPILPIIEVENLREAVEFVRAREPPMAIYPFTDDQSTKDLIHNTTTSGSIIYNSCFLQVAIPELPYGGVGGSGFGRGNIPYVLDAFSYVRASIDIPAALDPQLHVFYPPYTEQGLKMVNADVFCCRK